MAVLTCLGTEHDIKPLEKIISDQNEVVRLLLDAQSSERTRLELSNKQKNQDRIYFETEIKIQTEKIKQLEKSIAKLEKPIDNNTASTVLSAASLIVTALGVLIAILSIYGYQNIKKDSIKHARTTAKEVVKQICIKEIPKTTNDSVVKIMESEDFEKVIMTAVEKVAYRDISINTDNREE